ncbi:hypothetical protein BS47DRAFT_1348808 [Hydnum rufescens UP504]|uniref:Uncharacterized protein n=1 Tax=Hydnum rufescens UP504 TaxID=1448309 RepID=A0A9P6AQE8_9AGAM|nr:hypothetical protein BS47DRAFT_1348808 [Hydnum rufescens UP504]
MANSNVLHEIDLRIRTLSTLISDLHRQVERPELGCCLIPGCFKLCFKQPLFDWVKNVPKT